ncbi:MAG TPA: serine/threonine-protein kinase [Pirellulales bacterium]|nr:serine/threonine-protein kinase [Pirellulales bacterium]
MSGSEPTEELVDRLHLDQRARWLGGQRLAAEWYLDRYPSLRSHVDGLISLVYGEYCLREDLADGPDRQEYVDRFPSIAGELGRRFEIGRAKDGSAAPRVTAPAFPRRLNWPGKNKPLVLIDDRPDAAFPSASAAGFGPLRPGFIFYSLAVDSDEDESRCSGVEAFVPLEVLGCGSTGLVYRARRRGADEVVAIKFITLGPYENAEIARLVAAVRAVAALGLAGLVVVKDVAAWNGLPYIVEERVEGPSLEARLQGGPLTTVQAVRLAASLAQTLSALHHAGLVHGDLKPSNVIFDEQGAVRTCDAAIAAHLPKAANFGCLLFESQAASAVPERIRQLARAVRRPAETALVRHDRGYLIGHPSCLAPELLSGRSCELRPATDIYALGAVWYAALTGQLPLRGRTWQTTLELARQQTPPLASSVNVAVPPEIDALVMCCLSKQPGARPSASEVARQTAAWLEQRPADASEKWKVQSEK